MVEALEGLEGVLARDESTDGGERTEIATGRDVDGTRWWRRCHDAVV